MRVRLKPIKLQREWWIFWILWAGSLAVLSIISCVENKPQQVLLVVIQFILITVILNLSLSCLRSPGEIKDNKEFHPFCTILLFLALLLMAMDIGFASSGLIFWIKKGDLTVDETYFVIARICFYVSFIAALWLSEKEGDSRQINRLFAVAYGISVIIRFLKPEWQTELLKFVYGTEATFFENNGSTVVDYMWTPLLEAILTKTLIVPAKETGKRNSEVSIWRKK